VSSFGTYVTSLALQLLAVVTLAATPVQLGLLNAARWLPYTVLGLVVGVLVDRRRRLPILVGTDLGRAVLLCAIPALRAIGLLTMAGLIGVVLAFGTLSLLFDAADQAFLPRVVPRAGLRAANARLEQSDAVAQTAGPLIAGGLIRLVGAPLAVLVDAASYLASGLLIASVRVDEPAPDPAARRGVRAELGEGLAWVYRHRMLAPLATATHLWFFANSMLSTVYVLYAVRSPAQGGVGVGTVALGVSYGCAGAGAVLGGAFAGRLGRRAGVGPALIGCYLLMVLAWVAVPLTRAGAAAPVLLAGAQFVVWIGMGLDGPNELGYRQSVTPDRLQARCNTTMRSMNRSAIVLGAPLGGLIAQAAGFRGALWTGIGVMALAPLVLALTPFRTAGDHDAVPA
jgi:hypothetical protein